MTVQTIIAGGSSPSAIFAYLTNAKAALGQLDTQGFNQARKQIRQATKVVAAAHLNDFKLQGHITPKQENTQIFPSTYSSDATRRISNELDTWLFEQKEFFESYAQRRLSNIEIDNMFKSCLGDCVALAILRKALIFQQSIEENPSTKSHIQESEQVLCLLEEVNVLLEPRGFRFSTRLDTLSKMSSPSEQALRAIKFSEAELQRMFEISKSANRLKNQIEGLTTINLKDS